MWVARRRRAKKQCGASPCRKSLMAFGNGGCAIGSFQYISRRWCHVYCTRVLGARILVRCERAIFRTCGRCIGWHGPAPCVGGPVLPQARMGVVPPNRAAAPGTSSGGERTGCVGRPRISEAATHSELSTPSRHSPLVTQTGIVRGTAWSFPWVPLACAAGWHDRGSRASLIVRMWVKSTRSATQSLRVAANSLISTVRGSVRL